MSLDERLRAARPVADIEVPVDLEAMLAGSIRAGVRRRRTWKATAIATVAILLVLVSIPVFRSVSHRDSDVADRIQREQKEHEEREDSTKGPAPGSSSSRSGTDQGQSQSTNGKAPAGTETQVSPAGDRIAFASAEPDAEIYVMNADGSGRTHLGTGIEPDWSPDGESIVYARGRKTGNCEYVPAGVDNPDPCDVWVMDADGSNQRRLAAGFSPDWSPDGRRIAYAGGDDNDPEIRVMNADGSGDVQLTDRDDAIAGRPDWSPDGTRIAFGRNWQCDSSDLPGWCSHTEVMDATGGDQHFVINGIAPSWSPDGHRIAFMSGGNGGNSEIYTAKSDGSDRRRLTNDAKTASTMDNFDAWPGWLPDGRIIFTRDPDGPPTRVPPCTAGYSGSPTDAGAECGAGGPERPEIFLMNADGSGRVRVGEGRMAAFSPR